MKYGWAWLVSICLWTVTGTARAETQTAEVTFGERSLSVRVWYPDGVPVIRGVLAFTGGQGSGGSADTRGAIDNPFYRRFAESLGFAVLGNQFKGSYTDAANGPGQALLDALAKLAAESGHPELAHAPLLVHGFSNGGYFSFTFTQWAPERVIAFCLNKSGFTRAPLTKAFLAVPGVLFWGANEPLENLPTVVHSLVQQGRQQHALWAELKEWNQGHGDGEVERVSLPFFAEMVATRYPKDKTPLTGVPPLIALDEASGWLGDHGDASIESDLPVIARYAAYSGDKAAASWLPSEGIANLWRGFVTKNPIALAAPASAGQFDAREPLQLEAADLAAGQSAEFLDGARQLVTAAAEGGKAEASWTPEWGGVRGIVAVVKNGAEVVRISRPVAVVLYGKAPPPNPPPPVPSVDPADAGPGDAEVDAGTDRAADGGGCSAAGSGDAPGLLWMVLLLCYRARARARARARSGC